MNGHKPQEQSETWLVFWNNRTERKAEVIIRRWKRTVRNEKKLAGRLTRIFFSRVFPLLTARIARYMPVYSELICSVNLNRAKQRSAKIRGKKVAWNLMLFSKKTNDTESWGWRVRKSQQETANSRLLCFLGSFKTLFHPLKSRRAAKKCHTCIMYKYVVEQCSSCVKDVVVVGFVTLARGSVTRYG